MPIIFVGRGGIWGAWPRIKRPRWFFGGLSWGVTCSVLGSAAFAAIHVFGTPLRGVHQDFFSGFLWFLMFTTPAWLCLGFIVGIGLDLAYRFQIARSKPRAP